MATVRPFRLNTLWALLTVLTAASSLSHRPAAALAWPGSVTPSDTVTDTVAVEAPPAEALRPEMRGRRVVVAVDRRMLWVMEDRRVLFSARVAVGKPVRLEYDGRVWNFDTPRGRRVIQTKDTDPVWVPPEWHYVELAALQGWKLERLSKGSPARLAGGRTLAVRGSHVVLSGPGQPDHTFPPGTEIVVDGTLYVPPIGTVSRRVPGALGKHRLNLGDGYAIHGAPTAESIGGAETHGCIRLDEADLARLFASVTVGTPVYLF